MSSSLKVKTRQQEEGKELPNRPLLTVGCKLWSSKEVSREAHMKGADPQGSLDTGHLEPQL